MDPRDFATDDCSIGRALAVLGERWTFLVLREVFRGVRRFDDIRAVTGSSRQVLADRLAALVEQEILRRHPYQERGRRARFEYRLTDKGFDLYPILLALLAWGDRYTAGPNGPALRAEHRNCGAEIVLAVRCSAGHELTEMREVGAQPGRGARARADRRNTGSRRPAVAAGTR